MKKLYLIVTILVCLMGGKANAQTYEAQVLVLNYQKLMQLKDILDKMYKGYEILLKGYNTIKDISEGNFKLHQVFLDALYAVNPAVKKYKHIPSIIEYQQFLVAEGSKAYNKFRNDKNLTDREVKYIGHVYSYLFRQSVQNLDELLMILTPSQLRMSDDERIHAIDRIFHDLENKLAFMKEFNHSTRMLIMQRAKDKNEIETIRKLHEVE